MNSGSGGSEVSGLSGRGALGNKVVVVVRVTAVVLVAVLVTALGAQLVKALLAVTLP